ncbi:serine/threonine-protein kinase [Aquipuribacter sp. SD81]|uniref:serine/threonine-protein kinase n=1 Tax=Aquipuribacter sp. SD81 TaxID=3127703 RepID=UPI00301A0AFF
MTATNGPRLLAGRFRVVDLLGSGGMGAVWRVWDEREHRYAAAKVLRLQRADALLRFVAEQGTRVRHPHVLTPTGWAADDDQVLFTMDLVDGGSVADLVGDYGALPAPLVVTLLDQLLQALQAVHAAGVVHRDVTPGNLLLRATGDGPPHLLLSDFGVAVRSDLPRLTTAAEVVGTRGYVAPEVLAGADPAPAADLYTVGAVAVELLTGQRPPPDASAASLRAALDGAAAPWPLLQLVRGLLEEAPQRRPPDAATARSALPAVATDGGVRPGGDGTVAVLRHLPPLPDGWEADGPTAGRSPARTTAGPSSAPGHSGRGLPRWYRPVLGATAGLLLLVLSALGVLLAG